MEAAALFIFLRFTTSMFKLVLAQVSEQHQLGGHIRTSREDWSGFCCRVTCDARA